MDTHSNLTPTEMSVERQPWLVNWSAIWVGTLSAIAALVIFGLAGAALGYHLSGPDARLLDWRKAAMGSVVCSVTSAFFSFVIAGWVAGRIAGFRYSEPAMLHGAISWLVAVPLLVGAAALGGSGYLDNWYGSLGNTNTPTVTQSSATATDTTTPVLSQDDVRKIARNAALATITALLLGLIGAVLGGWMASGEQMTFTHHLHRSHHANAGNGSARTPDRVVLSR